VCFWVEEVGTLSSSLRAFSKTSDGGRLQKTGGGNISELRGRGRQQEGKTAADSLKAKKRKGGKREI